jgi:hypothetical protein
MASISDSYGVSLLVNAQLELMTNRGLKILYPTFDVDESSRPACQCLFNI